MDNLCSWTRILGPVSYRLWRSPCQRPLRHMTGRTTSGRSMLTTPLCNQSGIATQILSIGMSPPGGPTLATAVSNAGGGGIISSRAVASPAQCRR
jgi:hypothetical protein